MNSVAIALSTSLLAGAPSPGVSRQAQDIEEKLDGSWSWLQGSTSLGYEALLAGLNSLALECAAENWDGYGAAPVAQETLAQATAFLRALPLGVARPTIGAEPDGQVTFEWYASPRRTLSVSVSAEGDLHYAALLGPARQYGTEAFLGVIPSGILELIRRVENR